MNIQKSYVVYDWMVRDLKLKGNQLVLFAIFYGFLQCDNLWKVKYYHIKDLTALSKKQTIKILYELEDKGYIEIFEAVDNSFEIGICFGLINKLIKL